MMVMLKKITFAFLTALVLVNASVALTQPASASPNAEQGSGGAAGGYEYSHL
jgi:hypothetical protein